jgi:hypothetical protein
MWVSRRGETHQQEDPGAETDGAPDAAEGLAGGQVVAGSSLHGSGQHGVHVVWCLLGEVARTTRNCGEQPLEF